MSGLRFSLDVRRPELRSIEVQLEFEPDDLGLPATTRGGIELYLPTWTPGSYLIREYSRHINDPIAEDADNGTRLGLRKSAKNRFRLTVPADCRRVRIRYQVYAHELTVRTAHVAADHAYWNGACVFLWPLGLSQLSARVRVDHPVGWEIATPLPCAQSGPGFAELHAEDGLDQLIDSPCLVGTFERLEWDFRGVPHSMVLDGLAGVPTPAAMLDDIQAVVAQAAAVFGGDLPYERYLFLSLFSDAGHGGLEHRDSSTLLAGRTSLSRGRSYQEFLSLVAHEYFHVWNVKRMRPTELWEFDYEVENYTPMLWLAEGFTAYYDDYLCLRAGVLSRGEYLDIVARNLGNLLANRGRFHQSLSESSFDAWIRLYRPGENTRNTSQNYYAHGALAALVLDLTIRRDSNGERSLDDAVRSLYETTYLEGRGYRRDDVVRCLSDAADRDLGPTLGSLVDDALDPDFAPLLQEFGLEVVQTDRDKPYLGVAFRSGGTVVAQVTAESPAWTAGVAPGDEILAVQDLRVTADDWQQVFDAVAKIGQPLAVLLTRRGRIERLTVWPGIQPVGKLELRQNGAADPKALALRDGWLSTQRNPEM